ncbi:MAG TPA: MDR family MFS transporter [Chloroflexota bacterium]|nr:MDR family MFS transporter [Chloroflexota bacterium]
MPAANAPVGDRRLISLAMLCGIFLTAISSTVVATAAPSIIRSLEGLELYSWVFATYLIMMTVSTPLYGKLADSYGRKPVFLLGLAVFLLGSALCGFAQNMPQLLVFRLVQGLGAGAIQPIALTLAGDLFPIEQRARIQGLFSSMWALSSLIGPFVGGLLVVTLSWHWVFWVNLPVGVAAGVLMALTLHETVTHRRHQLDWPGAVAVALGVSAFLVALYALSGSAPGLPLGAWPLLILAVALLAFFIWWERRTPEPLLPLELFRIRVVAAGAVLVALGGVAMQGVASFGPLFVQGVLGGSPLQAGYALLPNDLTWIVGSVGSSRIILRYGYRTAITVGMSLALLGCLATSRVGADAPILVFGLVLGICGFGFGCIVAPVTIAVQNSVDWAQRGVATATTVFFQSIGRSVGVAVLGVALDAQLLALLGSEGLAGRGSSVDVVTDLLDPAQAATLDPAMAATLRQAFEQGLHGVFLLMAFTALTGLVVVRAFMPGGRAAEHLRGANAPAAPAYADDAARPRVGAAE